MIKKIIIKNIDIEKYTKNLVRTTNKLEGRIGNEVEKIIDRVRKEGDKALLFFAKKFDNCVLNKKTIRIKRSDINKFAKKCPKDIEKALVFSAERIKQGHF